MLEADLTTGCTSPARWRVTHHFPASIYSSAALPCVIYKQATHLEKYVLQNIRATVIKAMKPDRRLTKTKSSASREHCHFLLNIYRFLSWKSRWVTTVFSAKRDISISWRNGARDWERKWDTIESSVNIFLYLSKIIPLHTYIHISWFSHPI